MVRMTCASTSLTNLFRLQIRLALKRMLHADTVCTARRIGRQLVVGIDHVHIRALGQNVVICNGAGVAYVAMVQRCALLRTRPFGKDHVRR